MDLNVNDTRFSFKWNFLLLGIVITLFFLNGYHHTLFFRPGSIHQWRQADCLSITKNYYEEKLNFFEPKIHYQGVEDGKAVSEFPILNYSVALLWRLFGEHEFIYRLFEYLIFITSMFVFFNIAQRILKSVLFPFFIISIVITSPLIVYYSLNFIADVPAFSLGLIGFCFFCLFYLDQKMKHFYLALFIGTLAVLMKASSLTGLSILLFFSLIDICKLNAVFKTQKLFKNKTLPLIGIFLSLIIIFSWYSYALYYNNYNKNEVFLLTILPIWELNPEELSHAIKVLFNDFLLPWFLNKPMFFLFTCITLFVVVKIKQVNTFLKYSFFLSAAFSILYFIFFFQVFNLHDYYLINLMIFLIISLLCFADLVLKANFDRIESKISIGAISLLFICNSINAAAMYRLRTINNDSFVHWYPFVSEDEENLAKYLFWDYGNAIRRVENITPILRENNIRREDRVLSIPDPSFNISLYFMDQKGFTITRDHLINDSLVTDRFLKRNIQYVILSDTSLKDEIAFKRLTTHLQPYFIEKDVKVYRFSKN